MVDVTDGPDVDVRLGPLELRLRHWCPPSRTSVRPRRMHGLCFVVLAFARTGPGPWVRPEPSVSIGSLARCPRDCLVGSAPSLLACRHRDGVLGSAPGSLARSFACRLRDDLLRHVRWNLSVGVELHAVARPALGP